MRSLGVPNQALLAGIGLLLCLGAASASDADPGIRAWGYRSLGLEPAQIRIAEPWRLTYDQRSGGDLVGLRFREDVGYTRLLLDFTSPTYFVIDSIAEETIEVTLIGLDSARIGDRLGPPAGLVSNYRFLSNGERGARLVIESDVPMRIMATGELAPDDHVGHYRLFFDLAAESDAWARSFAVSRPDTVAASLASVEAAVEPGAAPAVAARVPERVGAARGDPRGEGLYLRVSGSAAFSEDTGDSIASVSDDAGNGWSVGGAVGYRVTPFARVELEGGRFDGFEVTNLAGRGDVSGWYGALNGFLSVPPTFWTLQPYIGAGIGLSYNDVDRITGGSAPPAPGDDQTEFLWQIFLGTEVRPLENLALDLGYRFADHGEITTGRAADGTVYDGDLRFHQVYLGVIYDF